MTPQETRKIEHEHKTRQILREIGHEVEAMKETPAIDDIIDEQVKFNLAVEKGDMKGMRRHGRRLCTLVTKMVVEEL
jgi:hypothetical protein